uniref:Uncharacterized protein n=1 Tax=Setaria italica TaxID=4555 RepID=K3ZPC0_SETIT
MFSKIHYSAEEIPKFLPRGSYQAMKGKCHLHAQ